MTTAAVSSWLPSALRIPLKHVITHSLRFGPVPHHIAFIMDGNRRFAKRRGDRPARGHVHGFEALRGLLDFLLELDVRQVTLFAFALNNFDRPAEEVETVMELARVNLLELARQDALLQEHGVRVFIVGRIELLPTNVQHACQEIMTLTQNNSRATLNVCVAYSSQDEIAQAVRQSRSSTASVEENMLTAINPYWTSPDLLVRTSGVHRLSDFLLWQCSDRTAIHILPCYWPEIGVADVIPVLLGWQANRIVEIVRKQLSGFVDLA